MPTDSIQTLGPSPNYENAQKLERTPESPEPENPLPPENLEQKTPEAEGLSEGTAEGTEEVCSITPPKIVDKTDEPVETHLAEPGASRLTEIAAKEEEEFITGVVDTHEHQ
jgi:hypothetical protein